MSTLEWLGSVIALVLTASMAAFFVGRLRRRWPTLTIRRRVLLSALVVEFVLAASLLAVERFVTNASWTWLLFGLLIAGLVATERQLKRSQRPTAAPRL